MHGEVPSTASVERANLHPLIRCSADKSSLEVLVATGGRIASVACTLATYWLLAHCLSPRTYGQLSLLLGLQSFGTTVVVGPLLIRRAREVWRLGQEGTMGPNSAPLVWMIWVAAMGVGVSGVLLGLGTEWIGPNDVVAVAAGFGFWTGCIVLNFVAVSMNELRERVTYALALSFEALTKLAIVGIALVARVEEAATLFASMQVGGGVGLLMAYWLRRGYIADAELTLGRLLRPSVVDTRHLRDIVGNVHPLYVSTALAWLLATGNRYVVEAMTTPEALGVFVVGWGLGVMALNSTDMLFSNIMVPVLYSRTSLERDVPQRRRIECGRYLALQLSVFAPLVVVLFLFARYLARLMIGAQFGDPTLIVQSSVMFAVFTAVSGSYAYFSLVERKLTPVVIGTGVAVATGLGSLVMLTPAYGVEAGAWGLTGGAALGCLMFVVLLSRKVDYQPLRRSLKTILTGCVLCAAGGWIVFSLRPYLPGPDKLILLGIWAFLGTVWAAWVWLGVRPRVVASLAMMP